MRVGELGLKTRHLEASEAKPNFDDGHSSGLMSQEYQRNNVNYFQSAKLLQLAITKNI